MDFDQIRLALETHVYIDRSVKDGLLDFFNPEWIRSVDTQRILCLLSPHGMGRTTLVKGLCAALAWKMIPISVGAIRNDSGILMGDRRSDINALAGRILHAIHTVGLSEQMMVVFLENIDRLDTTGLSNPSVNFFQVLNYVQEYAIKNNYQKVSVNFSKIVFIASATNLATIPSGIVEQMTVIPIPAYTEPEKLRIAKHYMIPELLDHYGLTGNLIISDNALLTIIRKYSRETGVAGFRHRLEHLCKTAIKKDREKGIKTSLKVYRNHLTKYLGIPEFPNYETSAKDTVGRVNILGRNEKGGCTLILEMLALKGDGKLTFTGNTDKIFQESGMVAVSYVRKSALKFGIEEDFYKKYDIHLHIMGGTTPKYGVSAGVGIITALVSVLSEKPVKGNIGMTGEISLHGDVLGVRDVRDKVLAACQAGIKTLFLPRQNESDVKLIPKEIRKQMSIYLIDHVDTLLEQAIVR